MTTPPPSSSPTWGSNAGPGAGHHQPTEPYAPAPAAGSSGHNPYAEYQPVHTAPTQTVGAGYREGLEHAAHAGVDVLGTRRQDGAFMFPGTEQIDHHRVFSGPGYLAPLPRRSPWATPAIWCSVIGLVAFPLLAFGLLGGILGVRDTRDGTRSGRGAARAAIALALMGTVIWLMIWYISFAASGRFG